MTLSSVSIDGAPTLLALANKDKLDKIDVNCFLSGLALDSQIFSTHHTPAGNFAGLLASAGDVPPGMACKLQHHTKKN